MISIRRTWKLVAVAFLTLAVASCDEAPTSPLEPSAPRAGLLDGLLSIVTGPTVTDTIAEAQIGPSGGTLAIAGGHSIYFPPGALSDTTTIRAVRHPSQLRIQFEPHGLTFPTGARPTLSFYYGDAGLGGLLGLPLNLLIVYLDDSGSLDEIHLGQVNLWHQTVSSRIDHFSTWALATD